MMDDGHFGYFMITRVTARGFNIYYGVHLG